MAELFDWFTIMAPSAAFPATEDNFFFPIFFRLRTAKKELAGIERERNRRIVEVGGGGTG